MSRALLFLVLSGCVHSAALIADRDKLKAEIDSAMSRTNCAPTDLARAQANLAFAELEFEEAYPTRAAEHLALGRQYAAVANECPDRNAEPVKAPPKQLSSLADKDGDGVPDTEDQCVSDPEDLDGFKDSDGCPDLDDDGDGVYDAQDQCPRDAEDRDNFQDFDGCPDLDNDGDGVPDTQDGCPLEPGTVARGGCPVRDRDGDGINDDVDTCADQPETLNEYLDSDGCPDTKPSRIEITGQQIVIKQRINFATGKAKILPDSFPVLDDVAQVMKDYPKINVEIGGHTDNVGDDARNQTLSKSRADAVFEYLIAKGIPASRLSTVGYGETRPIDTNRTEDGKLNNRRVEFLILGGGI